jgi:hypothetical protein
MTIDRIDLTISNLVELLLKFWLAQFVVGILLAFIGGSLFFLGGIFLAVLGGIAAGGA